MFETYTAAQYRGLDADAFQAREKEVYDLIDGGEFPEGVSIEDVSAELDLIQAEKSLRNKRNHAFNTKVEAVKAGAGNVIATTETETEEVRSMPKPEAHTLQARNREVSQRYTDTAEYREAYVRHLEGTEAMPVEMMRRALFEKRSNTPVSMNADFSNFTDPTFANTTSSLIIAPATLSDVVQREIREMSVLWDEVNHTTYQGQYSVSELDLMLTGAWIGDKEVSPYQADDDPEVFTWGWHQFEARHARTMLVQAVMDSKYDQVGTALAETYARAVDAAIWGGNGTTQPRGISNSLRLVGSDGKGLDSDLTAWYTQRTGTGKGHALIVEVTAADLDNWRFWCSLTWQKNFNRNYRGKGSLVTSDSMWGNHIQLLQDDNRHPIGRMDPLHDQVATSIVGLGAVKTLPNYVITDFESANAGDVIGVYGNLKGYTMNTQPGMPLSTTTWTDHETNTIKTKMLVAMDGRVHDPFGWLFLVKADEG